MIQLTKNTKLSTQLKNLLEPRGKTLLQKEKPVNQEKTFLQRENLRNLSTDFTSAVYYVRVNLTTLQVLVATDFELCTHKRYHMKWFSKLYLNVKFELTRSMSVKIGYPKSKHKFHLSCVLC